MTGDQPLAGLRVAILATDGFEQVELTGPRDAFQAAGATIMVLSPKPDKIQGFNHDEKGESVAVDIPLERADAGDYDALLLPGGALNADALRMEPQAQAFVCAMQAVGKPIAVICHAPWLLVSAGLVKGRTLTSYHTIQDDIRNAGGTWQDQAVVEDGNWISSRQPGDILQFNAAAIRLFAGHKRGAQV